MSQFKIEELELISCEKILKNGGTFPLLIEAFNEIGESDYYVMKAFKKKSVDENYSVFKEIFLSELAPDFNLAAPEYGVTLINNNDLIEIHDEAQKVVNSVDYVNQLDTGYKFCSYYLSGMTTMNPELITKGKLSQYDIENIYAFDQVFFNSDRGGMRDKPNLMIDDDNIIIIDHEQSLPFINSFEQNKNVNYFNYFKGFNSPKHIFYNQVKKLAKENDGKLFDEFIDNLRTINIKKFNDLFNELDRFGIAYGNKDDIFAYLYWAKENFSKVQNLLLEKLK
ncbi:HipA family kinase [Tenacibaculum sp. 190524A05c]|uniref:HipA family kinase n=1 Tax=Tenacibaculum platacis TaxID=3137852 RepID=UPI0032B188D4